MSHSCLFFLITLKHILNQSLRERAFLLNESPPYLFLYTDLLLG